MFNETGEICSNVVLFLIIGISGDSVKFGNIVEKLAKAVLIVKYMINLEFALSHAANDSRR